MGKTSETKTLLQQAEAIIDRALERSSGGSAVPVLVEHYHKLTSQEERRYLVAALAMRVVAAHEIDRMSGEAAGGRQ